MLIMGYANIPREDKVSDGGDDAWFVTNSIVNAMGVADGSYMVRFSLNDQSLMKRINVIK